MRIVPILRRSVLVAALAAAVAVSACGSDGGTAGAADGTIGVVASMYPLAEVTARVGGDRVSVEDLTPPGSESHDLDLGTGQVEAIEDAALVVVLGRGFQPAVERVAERRDGATLTLLEELGLPDAHDDAGDDGGGEDDGHGHEGGEDPHVWLDPTLMVEVVETVTASLAELDPTGADGYRARADELVAELQQLDDDYATTLAPCRGATMVVAHEAFGWLARRYGLVQEGIAGLSPEAEPSPSRMAELADLVRDEGITTVFTEALVSPRVAETLAREAGVATAVLDPIESLTDEQRAAGATYDSVMRENLATLRTSLDCG